MARREDDTGHCPDDSDDPNDAQRDNHATYLLVRSLFYGLRIRAASQWIERREIDAFDHFGAMLPLNRLSPRMVV